MIGVPTRRNWAGGQEKSSRQGIAFVLRIRQASPSKASRRKRHEGNRCTCCRHIVWVTSTLSGCVLCSKTLSSRSVPYLVLQHRQQRGINILRIFLTPRKKNHDKIHAHEVRMIFALLANIPLGKLPRATTRYVHFWFHHSFTLRIFLCCTSSACFWNTALPAGTCRLAWGQKQIKRKHHKASKIQDG